MPATLTGRDLVLDQSARLFLDSGYAETSVRDIAKACNVKAGSIYYHFASKAEILSEILDIGIEKITSGVQDALASSDDHTPQGRLRAAVKGHLTALFEHGPYTAAHVSVFHSAPAEVRAPGIVQRDTYEALWTGLIADLGNELNSDLDVNIARLGLLGAMNSTLDWYRPKGEMNLTSVADGIATQFLLGAVRR